MASLLFSKVCRLRAAAPLYGLYCTRQRQSLSRRINAVYFFVILLLILWYDLSETPKTGRPPKRPAGSIDFQRISSYMTALMVCMRFSASSKTMDCSDSNTSSVTSMALRPNFSPISRPTWVLRS